MRALHGLLLAVAMALPVTAAAQTDYTADDVVKHFEPTTRGLKLGGEKSQGTERGVTFGAAGFGEEDDAGKPEGAAEPAALSADAFNLSVTFDLDSDRLTGRAERNLREFAKALRRPELNGLRFAVEGHTDDSGTEDYNQELSERRAMSVVRFLTREGVERERLVPRGYGESRPVDASASRAQNRRVETRLLR